MDFFLPESLFYVDYFISCLAYQLHRCLLPDKRHGVASTPELGTK